MQTIPIMQITGSSICTYQEILNRKDRSESQRESESNLRDVSYNGYMSKKTKKKVSKFLEVWLWGVQQNLATIDKRHNNKKLFPTFVTLTLSSKQKHDDNFIKRNLLNHFILWLKTEHDVVHYFWRAEPQKNGNIHFHIICDRYIHWRSIRDKWNKIQDNFGYIQSYSEKMMNTTLAQYWSKFGKEKKSDFDKIKQYYNVQRASNWQDPNSTDIHGIENIVSLADYVIKYMTKTDGARKIDGRIWGCSDGLRELKSFSSAMCQVEYALASKLDNEPKIRFFAGEYFTVFYCKTLQYLYKNSKMLYYRVKSYYNDCFDYLYSFKNIVNSVSSPVVRIEKLLSEVVNDRLAKEFKAVDDVIQLEIPF